MARVLIVEDEPNMRKMIAMHLRQDGHSLVEAGSVREGLAALETNDFDVILTDQRLSDGEGTQILESVRHSDPTLSLVMLTAYGNVELAVETMRKGAFDFLTKPFASANLKAVILRAARHTQLNRENDILRDTLGRLEGGWEIRGTSPTIERLRQMIARVGQTDSTVLITGETGTGKELAARAIHRASQRAGRPLISVNCAAFSETLLESELFGHERGAFTGADRIRQGLFEAAHEGTLLLDEAGELSPSAQAKLLRVVAEGRITRLGSTSERRVNVRVIAATHRDLAREVEEGRFRQDLYYRLAVVPIHMPPLRERPEDIPEIADSLLTQIALDLKMPRKRLHPDALQQLMSYRFPGNVRELRNLLERAYILNSEPEILWVDLPETEQHTAGEDVRMPWAPSGSLPDELPLRATLATWERTILESMLARTNGSKAEAARRLGLSKSDLSYKLSKYGMLHSVAGSKV
jgi:two-component system response regulator HydG